MIPIPCQDLSDDRRGFASIVCERLPGPDESDERESGGVSVGKGRGC